MQTRLLACLAGGFLGAAVASTINASLGFNQTVAVIGCASAGVAIGYVASLLFDVFAATPGQKD